MKKAKVYLHSILAGILTEDDMGYEFRYDADYLKSDKSEAVRMVLQNNMNTRPLCNFVSV